jgi:hypothetical protein
MRKYKLISILIIILLFFGVSINEKLVNRDIQSRQSYYQHEMVTQSSSESTLQIINEIFDNKASSYATEGYFPQLYETSLQATYYGLSILQSLGKLDVINTSKMTDYIMDHYNSSSGVFMDTYSSRYLGTDFSQSYYPLSTLLEVNCFALLSLSLLGSLGLINIGKSIDFIWSCYNPVSSGFIGQSYHSNLEDEFKISTMDNTYYALITLDLLISTWTSYQTYQDELIAYINSLQNTNAGSWQYGGFYNDRSGSFDSLGYWLLEPNLLSSYYCIKSLELFEIVSSINNASFHQFVDSLYDPTNHYYRISQVDFDNFGNIIATALSLELSEIMSYPIINDTLTFLYTNRNAVGLWDGSTSSHKYELIDTFQILRSIFNAGEISIFNSDNTQQIITSLFTLFSSPQAFFLIPQEYNTMDLTYTMIKSFNLVNKISELDLQALYSDICDTYYYNDYFFINGFYSYIIKDDGYKGFRSFPLPYYSDGNKTYIDSIGYLMSHKATFQAVDSLLRMHKLDDFAATHNLSRLLDHILATQFLNDTYTDQNGGFLPMMVYDPSRAEQQSKKIFLEYSFYAIRTMELLTNQLSIGDITFLSFDIDGLVTYLLRNIIESSEILYFQPFHSNDTDTILQNTYYMIYILKTLDTYTLNTQKIENYINERIDYSNIKNIYYCYKLSQLLDLQYEFDSGLVQDLIRTIYSDSLHEFYMTSSREIINQEILLWICDIATSDPLKIVVQYDEQVLLGTYLSVTASLSNLVLSEFEYNLSFQFECAQLGNFVMEKEDSNHFSLQLYIPQRATNYPSIEGKLVAYDTHHRLAEKSIIVYTVYNQKYYKDDLNAAVVLSVLFLGVPGGFILISGKKIKRLT